MEKKITIASKLLLLLIFIFGVCSGSSLAAKSDVSYADEKQQEARQQEIEVSGTVTDAETEEPLPGVNIVVQGTTIGTTTDMDGEYSIEAPDDATLVFSFVGYQEQTVEIDGREMINVSLQEQVTELEEVVAIGYRDRARGEITGSVGQASGVDIEESATPDLEQSLQGKVPGLVVSDRGGNVGRQNMDFLVRGKSTLNNNSPLIVIDGVPRESFGSLSPNDIEDVSVLKDASAAIYGARAANGVILIQTKEGQTGEPEFSFQTEYGFQQETSYPTPMNSYERAKYYNEMYVNEGRQPMWSESALEHFRKGDKPLEYPDTDWYDVAIADRAPQTHHNLSMRGGTEDIQYYVSGDYLFQQGLLKSGDLTYNQYQLRSNITVQATDNLELGVNIEARVEKHEEPQDSNPWGDIISTYPWIKDRWPDGKLGPPTESMQNLITQSNREYGFDDETDKLFNAKINFAYDMPWLTEGLQFSGYANYNRELGDERTFYSLFPMYSYDSETGEYEEHTGFSRSHRGSRGVYSQTSNSLTDFYHLRLSYDRSFGEHNVSAFAAYEQSESWYKNLGAYRKNLPSDEKPYLWAGGESERDNWESIYESGRVNYFGSLGYNYARKYLIDFTLRYDGSFNFPKDGRFGLFPGVSVGYNISEESFMQGFDWLDNLKLRASYAKMGNDDVPSYQYLAQYDMYNAFSFGLDPRIEKAMSLSVTPNPNITWENSYQQNIGFDITVLEGLFTLNMDYFYEKRRQILLSRSASIPDYTALDLPDENIGKVDNQGVELDLNHENSVGSIDYSLGGNLTFNRNKIIYMDEPKDVPERRQQEGHPMDSWVVYKTDGLFRSQEEIDNNPSLPDTQPGDIKYIDVNGDGEISSDDMVRKFVSPIPEIQFGFNGRVQYKGLQLSAFLQGQTNAQTAMMGGGVEGHHWIKSFYENRWTPDNKDADLPRAFTRDDFYNKRTSEFWLEDATFLRLKTLTLSYTLPSEWTSSVGISNFRVYLRGRNIATWDRVKYGEYDPEREPWGAGTYPQISRYMLGATINF